MAAMDVSVQLRLLDQMSAPARRAAEALRNIERRARALGPAARGALQMAHAYDRLALSAQRAQAKIGALRGKALGVALGAFGLSLPLRVGADFEKSLVRFGQVAGWTAENMQQNILALSQELTTMARATRQSSSDLLQGMTTIVNLGVEADVARVAMLGIGRAATASGASVDELARTWHAASIHLGLSAEAAERAMNVLHQAGKKGGFELTDMARFFPSFLANVGVLYADFIKRSTAGMTPEEAKRWRDEFALRKLTEIASWAQVVRLGAADAETAGTNLQNIFQKNLIPETSKNFSKALGIDLRKAMWNVVNQGGDPILFVAERIADLVEKNKGNPLFLGELFADKQAMEGYLPIIRKVMHERGQLREFMKQVYAARDEGIISKDFATAVNTVSFAFKFFTDALSELYKALTLLGLGSPLRSFFEFLGDRIYDLVQLMQRNKELAGWLIRIGSGIMTAMGALVLLRFVIAALEFAFARAGMGAITLARAIPGAATAIGLFGAAAGRLLRLGLIGGAVGGLGFLAWQHWDQLRPHMESVGTWFLGFISRLSTMFPETFGWFTDTALPAITEWFQTNFPTLATFFWTLVDAGKQLWEALKWLFTGIGDANAFEIFKSSVASLGELLGDLFPRLEAIREFFSQLWDDLGSDSLFTRVGAWMKALGLGFLASSAGMILARGPAGLLMSLMALRTIMFVAGILIGLFSMLASIVTTFLTPFIESFFDSDLWKTRMAGPVAGFFGSIFAVIGLLILFREHWEAVKASLSGFVEGVQSIVGPAFQVLQEAWTDLMRTLFGEGEVNYTEQDLQDILSFWRNIGRIVGAIPAYAFRGLAWAIRELTAALKEFRDLVGQERFDAIVKWGSIIAGALVSWLALRGAIKAVGTALVWVLSKLNPFKWGGGGILGRITGFAMGALGSTAAGKIIEALRTGTLAKWAPRLLRFVGGPVGFFLLLFTVIGAVIDHLDELKAKLDEISNWGKDTWIGKLFSLMGDNIERDSTIARILGLWLKSKMQPAPADSNLQPQSGVESPFGHWAQMASQLNTGIEAAGRQAATEIQSSGSLIRSAVEQLAAAIRSSAASVAHAAHVPGGSLSNRAEGQLADAPYSSYP
jgi:hypothetical protein